MSMRLKILEYFTVALRFAGNLRCILDSPKEFFCFSDVFEKVVDMCKSKRRKIIGSAQCTSNNAKDEETIHFLNDIEAYFLKLQPLVRVLREAAPNYDFDNPGNGYRTFLHIVDSGATEAYYILIRNETWLYGELSTWLESITLMLIKIGHLRENCQPGELFPVEDGSIDDILTVVQRIDQTPFYGQFFALQYDKSLRPLLKLIMGVMCLCSERFYGSSALTLRFFGSEGRSQRLVKLSHHAELQFIRKFWKMSELSFLTWYTRFKNPIQVCKELVIQPEPLELVNEIGEIVTIPVPKAHIGVKPLHGLLISSKARMNMPLDKCEYPPSPFLIFHVHGGGFVSQSARSQECFMRAWAKKLDVPFFSVDYSLAPEAPFPRALEDVFYAYCWALKNTSMLGTTARKVICVGDSAGANLILGVVQACIDLKIRRPHGLALTYLPVLVSYTLSPARALGLMDCLLPFGFMMRCSEAYAGRPENTHEDSQQTCAETPMPMFQEKYQIQNEKKSLPTHTVIKRCSCPSCDGKKCILDCPNLEFPTESFRFFVPKDRYISPYWAPDSVLSQFPPLSIVTTSLDPCLDDCIMFAKKLRRLNNRVKLDIVEGMPHGFLNFIDYNGKAQEGSEICLKRIEELLDKQCCI